MILRGQCLNMHEDCHIILADEVSHSLFGEVFLVPCLLVSEIPKHSMYAIYPTHPNRGVSIGSSGILEKSQIFQVCS